MKRNVAILLFDEIEVLDFAGPLEVFGVADGLAGGETFNVFTVAESPGTIRARHGLKIVPTYTLEDCAAPDVLVVPGGIGTRPLLAKPALLEWLRLKTKRAELTLSVCTGALLLAKAGLLDGLRVTTHHQGLDLLRELAPTATIDPSARFHDNGKIVTAAGISAGIDAALYVVGRFLGEAAANATAHHMEYRRP